MTALGSLGHHFGKGFAKVAQRMSQGAKKVSKEPSFGDPFGYPERQFRCPLFCMFLGYLQRMAFGQFGSPIGVQKEVSGGPFDNLCRTCENFDF